MISIDAVGIKPDKVVPYNRDVWLSRHIDSQLFAAEKYVFGK